jgi:hypothetical protein
MALSLGAPVVDLTQTNEQHVDRLVINQKPSANIKSKIIEM